MRRGVRVVELQMGVIVAYVIEVVCEKEVDGERAKAGGLVQYAKIKLQPYLTELRYQCDVQYHSLTRKLKTPPSPFRKSTVTP